MPRFKTIPVNLERPVTETESALIDSLKSRINPDEIQLELAGDGTGNIHVSSLDVEAFRRAVDETLGEFDTALPDDNAARQIESAVVGHGSYGIKNGKRVFAGFADERKVKDRKAKEARRGKFFYAKHHPYSKKNVELPPTYRDQIIAGDSKDVLEGLPDNCVDIIVTSPPYNFGLDYEASPDDVDWERYLEQLFDVFEECVRVLKYGGRFIVNVQPLFSDYIPLHHIVSNWFIQRQLIWKGEILWEKNNYNCKYTAWGSWKSPSSPYLKYTWEFLEIFTKGSLKKGGSSEDADITADEFKDWVVAKWSIAPERNMKSFGHPAMFPEELVRRALKLFSFKGDVVLDPFNGAGTTTAVAQKTGRSYLGIDISEEYCQIARDRIDKQLPLL